MEKSEEYFEIKEYLEERLDVLNFSELGSEKYFIRESAYFRRKYEHLRITVLKKQKPKFCIFSKKPKFVGYVSFYRNGASTYHFSHEFQQLIF